MTRLILSKSFLPFRALTLAKQQTLFTSHAPTMQGQTQAQGDAEGTKVKLKPNFETMQEPYAFPLTNIIHIK